MIFTEVSIRIPGWGHLLRGFEQEVLDDSRNLVGFHFLHEVAMVLIRREFPLVAAIVVLGGLTTSTLLNLLVVPAGYSLIFARRPLRAPNQAETTIVDID